MERIERTPLSLERLDLVAVRGPQVAEAYANRSPVIAAIVPLITAAAEQYRQSREEVRMQQQRRDTDFAASQAATLALHRHVSMVHGSLLRDDLGYASVSEPARLAAPESVFGRAQTMINVLNDIGSRLSYAAVSSELLIPALRDAWHAHKVAVGDLSTLQNLQRKLRADSRALFEALLTLRGALKVLLGREHRDYQLLMVNAGRRAEETAEAGEGKAA